MTPAAMQWAVLQERNSKLKQTKPFIMGGKDAFLCSREIRSLSYKSVTTNISCKINIGTKGNNMAETQETYGDLFPNSQLSQQCFPAESSPLL